MTFLKIPQFAMRYDWVLVGAVWCLVVLGLLTLFSLSSVSAFPFFQRQLVWAAVGLLVMIGMSAVDVRLFRTQSGVVLLLYVVSTLLLMILLVGNTVIRGVESWFRFGSVLLQPAEIAKISLLILLAKFFSRRHVEIARFSPLVTSAVYTALPAALVLAQPDLGGAFVIVCVWLGMVVCSGIGIRRLLLVLAVGALLGATAWVWVLAPYQKDRVTAFLNPYEDPVGAGYQTIQSMVAVGSGNIFGKGLGYGSQTHLKFLPEPESDFIFAAFSEEWGFIGSAVLVSIYSVVLWRSIVIGMKATDNFSRLYAIGFAVLLFVQAFIHIGANMGTLPITGITLPFISYGGSSLVTSFAGLGILLSIKIHRALPADRDEAFVIA